MDNSVLIEHYLKLSEYKREQKTLMLDTQKIDCNSVAYM